MAAEHQDVDLRGQVGLVTGGGRGIGREVALGLARAGMAVGVLARTTAEVEETAELVVRENGLAIPLTADVTDLGAMVAAVAEVERQLGPINLMVANAGRNSSFGAVWEVEPGDWWREVEVNLRGPFVCARAVLPGMLERHIGRIVVVASGSGFGGAPGSSAYNCSKAGSIRFVDNLAREIREHGISVFAVGPGVLETRINHELALLCRKYLESNRPGAQSAPVKDYASLAVQGYDTFQWTPMERPVGLVLALASGRADALSGRFLAATDDLDDLIRRADEIERNDLHAMRLRK